MVDRDVEFSNDWFDRTVPIWEKHLLSLQVTNYLELGVCEGRSMRWVMENLKPDLAIGVDPWVDPKGKSHDVFAQYEQNCYRNLKPWLGNESVSLFKESSDEFLCRAVLEDMFPPFDLIYVDGDHTGYQCMSDMMLAYKLLAVDTGRRVLSTVDKKGRQNVATRTGGVMVVDDLQRVWHFGRPLVRIAVHAFEMVMHGRMHKIWEDGRQCAFVRVA